MAEHSDKDALGERNRDLVNEPEVVVMMHSQILRSIDVSKPIHHSTSGCTLNNRNNCCHAKDEENALQDGGSRFLSLGSMTEFTSSSRFFLSESTNSTRGVNGENKVKEEETQPIWSRIDKGTLQFALRISILFSISALFVLIQTEDFDLPDGIWVLITVCFVCWFPALDAASVLEKVFQRLMGTFVGAFLGLGCGFASSFLCKSNLVQVIFLECSVFTFVFLIIFGAGHAKVGSVKVIRKFSYATLLCVLTFCICVLPFAGTGDRKWMTAVWRVILVCIGCFLGALGSILLCPRSTTNALLEKAESQVRMAGVGAKEVLHTAADFFAGRIEVNGLADDLLKTTRESAIEWTFLDSNNTRKEESTTQIDTALKKCEEAIVDWRLSKMLFPLLRYDPFHLPTKTSSSNQTHKSIARTLACALRIQTTIVVMDGMIRCQAEYDLHPSHLLMFSEVGRSIRQMLTTPLDEARSDGAAEQLFQSLEQTRNHIIRMSTAVSIGDDTFEESRGKCMSEFKRHLLGSTCTTGGDENGRYIPKDVTGKHENTLFFLQLVEHLILRSLRLYQAWKEVDHHR